MEQPVCILAAVREELSDILRQMAVSEKRRLGGAEVWRGSWLGRGLLLVRTGVGRRRASLALTALLETYSPGLIVSMGYAGGTDPALKVGDLLLAERVLDRPDPARPVDETGSFAVDKALAERFAAVAPPAGAALFRGALLTVDEVVSDPEKKRALGISHGALALDMETAALARLALERGVPFISLRAISDAVDDALLDVSPFLQADGEVSKLKAGWYVLTHPGAIGGFLSLKAVAERATARMTEFLAAAIGEL